MEQNVKQQTPEQPEGTAVKSGVLMEIAGGYLLGATIMSFLALWTVGVLQLNYI